MHTIGVKVLGSPLELARQRRLASNTMMHHAAKWVVDQDLHSSFLVLVALVLGSLVSIQQTKVSKGAMIVTWATTHQGRTGPHHRILFVHIGSLVVDSPAFGELDLVVAVS